MSLFPPPAAPATELSIPRPFPPPLVLGAMSTGHKWGAFMGSMDKESSFKLLDAYYQAGGSFIDRTFHLSPISPSYSQGESSEEFIDEWMQGRNNRDQIVVTTKYANNYKSGQNDEFPIQDDGLCNEFMISSTLVS